MREFDSEGYSGAQKRHGKSKSGPRKSFSGPRKSFSGRDSGGGGFRDREFGRFQEPKQMHKAICSECQKECEVPFKPTEGRQVYCRDCFRNHRKF